MNMKAVYSFKMLGFRNCATQCNNLEDVNPQPQHCANFRSCIKFAYRSEAFKCLVISRQS